MNLSHSEFRQFNGLVASLYDLAFQLGPLVAISRMLPKMIDGVAGAASIGLERTGRLDVSFSELSIAKALMVVPREVFFTHPRSDHRVAAGEVMRISDLMNKRAWRNRELYHNLQPWVRLEDDMGVDFRTADGSVFKACVMRDQGSFSDKDRDRFELLLPHFKTLLGRAGVQVAGTGASADWGLTNREQEVLHWLMEGKTNREIGEILHIALGTVKIHLEHIYDKLGVENRHGAARRMLERSAGLSGLTAKDR